MPALLIRGLPPVLHEKLKEEARRHHRSMAGEALAVLEQSLGTAPVPSLRDVKPVPCRIRIDDAWIKRARERGRS